MRPWYTSAGQQHRLGAAWTTRLCTDRRGPCGVHIHTTRGVTVPVTRQWFCCINVRVDRSRGYHIFMSWDDCSVMVGLFLFIYFTSFRPDLLDVLLLELHIN